MAIDDMAARRLALRAEAARSDNGRSIVVGISAVACAQVFIVATLGPVANSPWFWVQSAMVAAVVVATVALLVAHQLIRPSDADLLGIWIPLSRTVGTVLNLSVVASPWILLPLVGPVMAGVFYLIYAWFLAVTATFSTDDSESAGLALLGLPLSLSAYLLFAHAAFALPLAGFFCLFGLSLWYFERQRRKARASSLEARLAGERAAADLLVRLETMSLIPQTVSSDAAPDVVPAGGVLTPRQVEVLRHVAKGQSNKEIARELKISPATVKVHVAQILATTGAGNRTAAAVTMLQSP